MTKSEEEKKYYCGWREPVPKGKIRAPVEYCIQNNQIKYYGIVAIDPELLEKYKGTSSDLTKEKLKLKKIEDDAKILIKEVKNIKLILEDDTAKASSTKKAQKRLDELLAKRDKLVKKLKTQKLVVENIEADQKQREEAENRAKKKSKSGSKTSNKKKK